MAATSGNVAALGPFAPPREDDSEGPPKASKISQRVIVWVGGPSPSPVGGPQGGRALSHEPQSSCSVMLAPSGKGGGVGLAFPPPKGGPLSLSFLPPFGALSDDFSAHFQPRFRT